MGTLALALWVGNAPVGVGVTRGVEVGTGGSVGGGGNVPEVEPLGDALEVGYGGADNVSVMVAVIPGVIVLVPNGVELIEGDKLEVGQ